MKRLSFLFVAMLLATPAIAADSTSFNPSTMASVTAQAETPVGTIMTWAVNTAPPTVAGEVIWLPCDGQAIPSGTEYDQLRTLLGSSNLPNLNNNQFLKGSTTDIGKQVAQATVNTTVNIPDHKHDLASGVASGQTFTYNAPSGVSGNLYKHRVAQACDQLAVNEYRYSMVTNGCHSIGFSHMIPTSGRYLEGTLLSGSTTAYGTTSASGLSGVTGAAGATTLNFSDIANPAHINVKYYMKVKN